MLTALMTLLATLSSIFRSRAALELENLALRHQIGVLRRAATKRLKLTSADRLLWICLSRLWRGWRSALTIVKPETVIAWHRAGFRLFWTWKVRCGQSGRPIISPEVRALIRKMCMENPRGAPRIHGELLKLGINIAESDSEILFRVLSSVENASFARKGPAGATSDSAARNGVFGGGAAGRWLHHRYERRAA